MFRGDCGTATKCGWAILAFSHRGQSKGGISHVKPRMIQKTCQLPKAKKEPGDFLRLEKLQPGWPGFGGGRVCVKN
jgi:hypothetical protein